MLSTSSPHTFSPPRAQLTPVTASAPVGLAGQVCELVLGFLCSYLMVSLQWGLEYVVSAVVLSKPISRIIIIKKKKNVVISVTCVVHPYSEARVSKKVLGWMGPELGTSVLKTGSSFSQKHLCCPAKVAWLRRWAAVYWALMESKMQSLQSYSWEWDGLYLLSLDPTQHASPVPARISCVGSRGAPRSHAEESFLDVAVGVQKTK